MILELVWTSVSIAPPYSCPAKSNQPNQYCFWKGTDARIVFLFFRRGIGLICLESFSHVASQLTLSIGGNTLLRCPSIPRERSSSKSILFLVSISAERWFKKNEPFCDRTYVVRYSSKSWHDRENFHLVRTGNCILPDSITKVGGERNIAYSSLRACRTKQKAIYYVVFLSRYRFLYAVERENIVAADPGMIH